MYPTNRTFGPESLPFYPDKQGFSHHFVIDKPDRQSNPEWDPHWSDYIGDNSVDFIKENADQPFFLFMSFSAIHDPLIEKADSIARQTPLRKGKGWLYEDGIRVPLVIRWPGVIEEGVVGGE